MRDAATSVSGLPGRRSERRTRPPGVKPYALDSENLVGERFALRS